MAVLTRTNYIPNTLIESAKVNVDFNQLVDLLSGVSTTKDALIKFSDGSNPVLRVDQLGAGLIQQWLNNGTARASMSALGKLLLPAGIGSTPSTDQISNFGAYFVDFANRDTDADTNEKDFSSKTLSANVMANDGDFIVGLATVSYQANANTKRYRLYFGGSAFYDSTALALNGVNQMILFLLVRRSSTIIKGTTVSFVTAFGTGTALQDNQFGSQNFTTTNILKSTGQNGTASNDDIVQTGFVLIKGSV